MEMLANSPHWEDVRPAAGKAAFEIAPDVESAFIFHGRGMAIRQHVNRLRFIENFAYNIYPLLSLLFEDYFNLSEKLSFRGLGEGC